MVYKDKIFFALMLFQLYAVVFPVSPPFFPNICEVGCVCSSYSIRCNSGNLTSVPKGLYMRKSALYLSYNNITVIKPSDFENFKSLRTLYLQGNPIKNIPSFVFLHLKFLSTLYLTADSIEVGAFHGLTSLRTLVIIGSSKLQEIDVSLFKPLSNLLSIQINGTSIRTIKQFQFSGFPFLSSVKLFSNQIESIEDNAFEGSPKVREINLYDNKLANLAEDVFQGLEELLTLNLSTNVISTIHKRTFFPLLGLRQLSIGFNKLKMLDNETFVKQNRLNLLDLQHNKLESVPQSLNIKHSDVRSTQTIYSILHRIFINRYSLSELYLNNNKLKKFLLSELPELKTLKTLRLEDNKIDKVDFGDARSLYEVDLSRNCLSDFPSFPGNSVRMLIMNECCLKDEDLQTVKWPYGLQYLDLHKNSFSHFNITKSFTFLNLSNCNLKYLDTQYSYNRFSVLDVSNNPGIQIRGTLNGLKELYIRSNEMTSLNISSIKMSTSSTIQKVDASNNRITNMTFDGSKLTSINLSNNTITKLDKQVLQPLANSLEEFIISNNKLNGKVGSEFDGFVSLKKLNLDDNNIEALNDETFDSMSSLKELSLKNNKLTRLPLISNAKLVKLDLSGMSSFKCGCNLTVAVNMISVDGENIFGECEQDGKTRTIQSLIMPLLELTKFNCNLCPLSPCNFRGDCKENTVTGFECDCHQGYTGATCEIYQYDCFKTQQCRLCNNTSCNNNGSCEEVSPTHAICNCHSGYSGDHCEKYDPCMNSQCVYGACLENSINYTCTCDSGYTGKLCENIIQTGCEKSYGLCDENTCHNGGQCCETSPSTIQCYCQRGYVGDFCHLKPSDRLSVVQKRFDKGMLAAIVLGVLLLLFLIVLVWAYFTKRIIIRNMFGGSLHYQVSNEKTLIDNENDF